VIPQRHSTHYFDMTAAEKQDLWQLVEEVTALIRERYQPDGFNIGFNVLPAGGQTIFHTHVHIIPRYAGDVEDPRGGVRGVIPGKQRYEGGAHV